VVFRGDDEFFRWDAVKKYTGCSVGSTAIHKNSEIGRSAITRQAAGVEGRRY
jgi:hypothetical protein